MANSDERMIPGSRHLFFPRLIARLTLVWICGSFLCLGSPAFSGEVEDAIAAQVQPISEGHLISVGGVKLSTPDFIARLYELRQFRPVWDTDQRRTELSVQLSEALLQGFRPEDFQVDDLTRLAAIADAGGPQDIATFDIAATEAAARLLHHLYFGKVNPAKLDAAWGFDRAFAPGDPASIVHQYLEVASFEALIDDFELAHPAYLRMQQGLSRLVDLAERGGWPLVPEGATLKPGMEDERLPFLRQRLAISGDFDGPQGGGFVYDPAVEAAVKVFQRRHGLEPDGIIGPRTYRALNRTIEDRINQMRVSLERARWTLRDLGAEYVLVNIGGAETFYVRDDEMVWRTRSVVGQAYRKTPLFQDSIRYVEFNPTWTVPRSIFLKDKLPRIRKDVAYLQRGGYSVVDSDGRSLDPGAVNWMSDNPDVTLVQRPGPDNALGLIKFMFPNAHAVYLHDTNDRDLFDRAERNLSSGCVRIEHPFELADLLLQGSQDWFPGRSDQLIATGKTTRIDLPRPIPIVLTYYTAWVDTDGTFQFREDVYERDEAVLSALNAAFRS